MTRPADPEPPERPGRDRLPALILGAFCVLVVLGFVWSTGRVLGTW